jgi:hypothetical protein
VWVESGEERVQPLEGAMAKRKQPSPAKRQPPESVVVRRLAVCSYCGFEQRFAKLFRWGGREGHQGVVRLYGSQGSLRH